MVRILIALLVLVPEYRAFARDLDALYNKANFKIGAQSFAAYIADNEKRRADGLMHITSLPENTGMLFVFDGEQPLSFWMKNTMIPLAIAFIDAKGVIVDIQEMQVAESIVSLNIPTYQSKKSARFALEMNQGWFTRHKIKVGAKLSTQTKSLADSLGLPTSGSPK